MSLSSRGCQATVDFVQSCEDGLIVEFTTKGKNKYYRKGKYKKEDEYIPDFTARALFYDKGEQLNKGDIIHIKSFYLKNRSKRLISNSWSLIVTEWLIVKRNQYVKKYYGKSKEEIEETKRRQRQAIEEEIEAEEQDLDEYIENNGDEDLPF